MNGLVPWTGMKCTRYRKEREQNVLEQTARYKKRRGTVVAGGELVYKNKVLDEWQTRWNDKD